MASGVELKVIGGVDSPSFDDELDGYGHEPSVLPLEEATLLGGANDDSAGSCITKRGPFRLVRGLNRTFGYQFLIVLFVSQHLVKGLLSVLVGTPMQFIYKQKNVAGPRMQIIGGVTALPWAMKPIFGFISDFFPIMGLSKSPYLAMASTLGVAAVAALAFMPLDRVPIEVIAMCAFAISVQISVVDLLTEAKYAEKMHAHPDEGPNLLTFVWFGMTLAGMCGTLAVGPILAHYGNQAPYLLALLPAAAIFWPLSQNHLGERREHPQATRDRRTKMWQQPMLVFLVMLMFGGTLALSAVGISFESVRLNAALSITMAVVVLLAFSVCLSPVIAKVNAFFLIQTSLSLGTGGASFYFMTDTAEQYPEGPHFSKEFYTSVLGIVGAITSMVGIYSYNKYMQHWPYRRLLLFTNCVSAVLSLLDVVFFTRYNLRLGISDHVFVLGSSVSQQLIGQWMWMPGVVILAQLCPRGIEGTMYALLAGCHNLGNTISGNSGALMLQLLGVAPSGAVNESAQFERLWIASAISTVLPAFTLLLLPWMIPNASQKDTLLKDAQADDPHAGSIMRRLFG